MTTAVARRLHLVQPRPAMGKVDAPYLTSRPGALRPDGSRSVRWFFQPPSRDAARGWAAVRLHDQHERPIADALEAAAACRALAEIYTKWRDGVEGYGPHMIDRLGRVVVAPKKTAKIRREEKRNRNFKAGTIGAMVHDFQNHAIWRELGDKTQLEYQTYLGMFVDKFGDTAWNKLAPGTVRAWLLQHGTDNGPAGAHSLYRTARAFLGQVRLCYDRVDHPGFVPENANPLAKLKMPMPKATLLAWPREAVDAFVALADEAGEPSIGDALVMMSWLGVRRQDWLEWPADFFERELLAFSQEKTGVPNVLPWSIVPALVERVAAAKARRPADAVTSARFFHDRNGLPWKDADAFRDAFNGLRARLAEKHPSFATRYYVGLVPGNPLAVPTARLTMRTMRHTCVTLNADTGMPSNLIGGITGHSQKEIDEILACYRARTAEQAAAALNWRIDYETKGAIA